jgi:hypothetical protein
MNCKNLLLPCTDSAVPRQGFDGYRTTSRPHNIMASRTPGKHGRHFPSSNDEWLAHKDLINSFSIKQNLSLCQKMAIMRQHHGFVASGRQYKLRFVQWDFALKKLTTRLYNAMYTVMQHANCHLQRQSVSIVPFSGAGRRVHACKDVLKQLKRSSAKRDDGFVAITLEEAIETLKGISGTSFAVLDTGSYGTEANVSGWRFWLLPARCRRCPESCSHEDYEIEQEFEKLAAESSITYGQQPRTSGQLRSSPSNLQRKLLVCRTGQHIFKNHNAVWKTS